MLRNVGSYKLEEVMLDFARLDHRISLRNCLAVFVTAEICLVVPQKTVTAKKKHFMHQGSGLNGCWGFLRCRFGALHLVVFSVMLKLKLCAKC